ncbi:uncharacterized protein LOC132733165 [Ruditapes philippinarum]|uniref:uncharacterized protein LOC132733165 n=1 Tax=Ruditapes philippinarum TaxID=129788 RepID=UPI00295B4055|nr:uncharacterized protein LOC132733165 [Ruditapes philippinarum]
MEVGEIWGPVRKKNVLNERMPQKENEATKRSPKKTHRSVVEQTPQADKQTPKKSPQKTHRSVVEQNQNDEYVTMLQIESILDGYFRKSEFRRFKKKVETVSANEEETTNLETLIKTKATCMMQ